MRLPKTRDCDIRPILLAQLQQEFSDPSHDLILEEFGCNAARVDVAVVNGALHAFEIKSDSDTLERLTGQVEQYGQVFDFVTLVCGHRLLPAAKLIVPQWWGLRLARHDDDSRAIQVTEIRQPQKNRGQDANALARMLWKREALSCLRRNGYKHLKSNSSAEQVWSEAAQRLSVGALAQETRDAIRARGGSGFAKRFWQDGDSCTTESTALLDHYCSNLNWLLSRLSPNLHD